MDTLLIFFLNRSFLDIVEKNQKSDFKKKESSSRFCILILNGAQNFIGFIYATLIGWILYPFQDTSTVSILRKREDQALISISTILKFSAQSSQKKSENMQDFNLNSKEMKIRFKIFIMNRFFLQKETKDETSVCSIVHF